MIRACIYARYSSNAQREESIEAQVRACRDYANRRDYYIIEEYCDRALTGTNDHRPEFQRMLSDAERKAFDVIVCYTVDRFARNRYDSAIHKHELKKHGVRVEYATQSFGDEPEGILLESLMEGYAEYYSVNLAKHVKRGQHESALKCHLAGGRTPYGYDKGPDGSFVVNEAEAEVVRDVYVQYLEGKSPLTIARGLNAKGLRSRRNKPFTGKSFTTMLQNRCYIGTYHFGDVEVEGGVPSIVPRETFDRVQELRKSNDHEGARHKALAEYILSGKMFCGICGEPLIGESGYGHGGGIHYYYKCANRKKKSTNCPKRIDRKEFLESTICQYIIDEVLTDETITQIAEAVIRIIEKENNNRVQIEAARAQIKENEKKIAHLLSLIEDGAGSKAMALRMAELEQTNEQLADNIKEMEVRLPSLTVDHVRFWLLQFKSGDISDPSYTKTLVQTMVDSIYVYDIDAHIRKIRILLNISGDNERTFMGSDLSSEVRFKVSNANLYWVRGYIVLEIKRCA